MSDLPPGFWLSLLQFAWLVAISIAVYMRKPGQDAQLKLDALKDTVEERHRVFDLALAEARNDQRLINERISHLPTHADIRALTDKVGQMNATIGGFTTALVRQEKVTERIEDYLNNQRNKT